MTVTCRPFGPHRRQPRDHIANRIKPPPKTIKLRVRRPMRIVGGCTHQNVEGQKEIPMPNTGWRRRLAMFVFCLMVAFDVPSARAQGANDQKAGHGAEFWRKIAKNRYAIPPGEQVFGLTLELSGYL